jgi:hypothetical protein
MDKTLKATKGLHDAVNKNLYAPMVINLIRFRSAEVAIKDSLFDDS